MGIFLYHLKQLSEAKASLNQALALQKELKTPEVTEILADIHIQLAKDYKECESALKLRPDFVQGYIWLGNIHYYQEKSEKAINRNTNDAEPHSYLGLTFEKLKRIDVAEKEYERVIEPNANFAEAHYQLGLLYKSQEIVAAVSQLKSTWITILAEAKECLKVLIITTCENQRS